MWYPVIAILVALAQPVTVTVNVDVSYTNEATCRAHLVETSRAVVSAIVAVRDDIPRDTDFTVIAQCKRDTDA